MKTLFIGRCIHVCSGMSQLGDVRVDLNEPTAQIRCDASNMRDHVVDGAFETALCDPPYNGKFQWNHDLLSELCRVASKRIIFQHWFIPANPNGRYKKVCMAAQDLFWAGANYIEPFTRMSLRGIRWDKAATKELRRGQEIGEPTFNAARETKQR